MSSERSASSSLEQLSAPDTILVGKYRVVRTIGEGGMGRVLEAKHLELRERVALKLLKQVDGEAVARFLNEARAAFRLRSQHVVRVLDAGRMDNGFPYLVMEYLEGEDLSARIAREGALPISTAVDMVLQACEAISEAHSIGIIHRDLKPANLFVVRSNQVVKVCDFGIAKLLHEDATGAQTRPEAILGSLAYMAPEQLQSSRDVDARADVYALGVVLFEALTGSLPFNAPTIHNLLFSVLHTPAPALKTLRADVPDELEKLVLLCLEKERGKRPADVLSLMEQLLPFSSAVGRSVAERALQLPASTVAVSNDAVRSEVGMQTAHGLRRRATAARSAARYEQAIEDFSSALQLTPDDAELYAQRAYVRELLGDTSGAIADLSEALRRRPEEGIFLAERAKLAAGLGQRKRAKSDYQRAYELLAQRCKDGTTNTATLLAYAQTLHGLGRCAEAEVVFEQAQQLAPEDELVLRARADHLVDHRLYERAIGELSRVLELHPQAAALLAFRADLYSLLGETAHSAADWGRFLRIAPQSHSAFRARASARKRLGDRAGAREDLEAALRLLDAVPETPLYKGLLFERKGLVLEELERFDEALDAFSKAIAHTPEEPSFLASRAWLLRKKRDYPAALTDLHRAISLDPELPSLYMYRAYLYEDMAELPRAIADTTKAIELDAEEPYRYRARARLHELRADFSRALADWNQSIVLTGKDTPDTHFAARARLRKQLGDPWGAVDDLRSAVQKCGNEQTHARALAEALLAAAVLTLENAERSGDRTVHPLLESVRSVL